MLPEATREFNFHPGRFTNSKKNARVDTRWNRRNALGSRGLKMLFLHYSKAGIENQTPNVYYVRGFGGRGRNRTYNLSIKSRMLCQLSYASEGILQAGRGHKRTAEERISQRTGGL